MLLTMMQITKKTKKKNEKKNQIILLKMSLVPCSVGVHHIYEQGGPQTVLCSLTTNFSVRPLCGGEVKVNGEGLSSQIGVPISLLKRLGQTPPCNVATVVQPVSVHIYIGEESSSRLSALFKDTYMASAGLTPSIFCYKTSDLPLSRTPLYTEGVSIKNRSVPMAYPFEILHSTSREQYAVNS